MSSSTLGPRSQPSCSGSRRMTKSRKWRTTLVLVVFLSTTILTVRANPAASDEDIPSRSSRSEDEDGQGSRSLRDYEKACNYSSPIPSIEERVSCLLHKFGTHDRRIRPNYGGAPVNVNVTIHVIHISAVSESTMDYTLDIYLRQMWVDERLAFEPFNENLTSLTIGIEMVRSIWTPDTFFPNEKKSFFHEATSHNSFLRISSDGTVLRSIRLTVTPNCNMELKDFPLDTQVCKLEIESYGYGTKDIVYNWNDVVSVTLEDDLKLPQFSVYGTVCHKQWVYGSLNTGAYSRLTANFVFERNIGFYLIQIYFPASLIVVISWVSFWLNREAVQARVAIGVTTVLTMTTLMTSTNSSLPKVSYVKSLDIFLGVCFFVVFASLLEYAALGYLMKRRRRMMLKANGGASSPVHYFETETANNTACNGNAGKAKNRNKKKSVQIPMDHLDAEHVVPLLVAVPVTRRVTWYFNPVQIDLASRFIFPIIFTLFQITYWMTYYGVKGNSLHLYFNRPDINCTLPDTVLRRLGAL